jgi:hypothetical protein
MCAFLLSHQREVANGKSPRPPKEGGMGHQGESEYAELARGLPHS